MDLPPHTLGSVLSGLVSDVSEREAYNADPDAFLAERGFPSLPDRVVGEAVCQVADTLPAPVAEQLAPQVMALSPLTTADTSELGPSTGMDALDALATVPAHEFGDTDVDTLDLDADLDIDVDDAGTPAGHAGAADDEDEEEPAREDAVEGDAFHEDPGFGTGESQPQATEAVDPDGLSSIEPADSSLGLDDLADEEDLSDGEAIVFEDPVADGADFRLDGDRSKEDATDSTVTGDETDEPEVDIDWS